MDELKPILYLVVGITYFLFKNYKPKDPIQEEAPSMPMPANAPKRDWEAVAGKPVCNDKKKKTVATSTNPVVATSPLPYTPLTKQPQLSTPDSKKKIDSVLGRYKGLKKAIVMGEIFSPKYIA